MFNNSKLVRLLLVGAGATLAATEAALASLAMTPAPLAGALGPLGLLAVGGYCAYRAVKAYRNRR